LAVADIGVAGEVIGDRTVCSAHGQAGIVGSRSDKTTLTTPRPAQLTLNQLPYGQSLTRRILSGFLTVSTELANRAVSSMCFAGLCESPAGVGCAFDRSSSSSTGGFCGIVVIQLEIIMFWQFHAT
jgi:hypothetical protein